MLLFCRTKSASRSSRTAVTPASQRQARWASYLFAKAGCFFLLCPALGYNGLFLGKFWCSGARWTRMSKPFPAVCAALLQCFYRQRKRTACSERPWAFAKGVHINTLQVDEYATSCGASSATLFATFCALCHVPCHALHVLVLHVSPKGSKHHRTKR